MSHRPDRPIDDPADDALGRDGFVARLARALVTPDGRASGVVVGLTGPWGSGKSSLLNMLAITLRTQHEGAVVVRFDPWLVSGRDDLVIRFIKEINARIREVGTANPQNRDALFKLANQLALYGKDLAGGAAWLLFGNIPFAGTALTGVSQWIASITGHVSTLDAQREAIKKCLDG